MTEPTDPLAFELPPLLAAFLAGSKTILLGRIDRQGMVVADNPSLRRWVGEGSPSFEAVLSPRSVSRWRRRQAEPNEPGDSRTLILRLCRGRSRRAAFRCLVVSECEGSCLLIGEPVSGVATAVSRSKLDRVRRRAFLLARTDPLTGLANRRQGDRWLAKLSERAGREGIPLACLMVDIDHFKSINDTLGHPVGDRVLAETARALVEGVRGSDRVARYGGEEFLILLPGTELADAVAVAERLRSLVAARRVAALGRPLTASFGVAASRSGEAAEDLLNRADAALLRAKGGGRDRVEADA